MNALSLAALAIFSMRRRARRAVLSLVALAVFVSAFGSILLFEAALEARTRTVAAHAPDLTVQRLVAGRPALLDPALAASVAAIPGVRSVDARAWGYLFVPPLSANVSVLGVAPSQALFRAITQGRAPVDGAQDELALGHALAQALSIRVGENLALVVRGELRRFAVVGIVDPRADGFAADAMLAPRALARRMLGLRDDQATDLAVTLSTPDEQRVVAEKIVAASHELRVVARPDSERGLLLTTGARASFSSLSLFPAFVALCLLLLERLSSFDPVERREIGALKALGFSTRALIGSKLLESALIGVAATVIGIAVAYVHVHVLGAPLLRDTLLGWSRLLPSTAITPAFGLGDLLALLAAVVVPYVGISLLSAWRIAFVDPDVALRGAP